MFEAYIQQFLRETEQIAQKLLAEQVPAIEKMIMVLQEVKEKRGRVFFAGIGGGSGTGTHSANDFNKIAEISTFCLTDNPSLFTALGNDEGWDSIFSRQMEMHHFGPTDCLFVYSVGGGNPKTSPSLVKAVDYAKAQGGKVVGVVGKPQGHAQTHGDAVLAIPIMHESRITPHSESWQLVMDHLIVTALQRVKMVRVVQAD